MLKFWCYPAVTATVANLVYLDCELQFTIGDYDDFSVALLESKVVKNFKLLKE